MLHVKYTARDAGGLLKQAAQTGLASAFDAIVAGQGELGLSRLFSMRHEFPSEWRRLTNVVTAGKLSEELAITKNRFPFMFGSTDTAITVSKVELFAVPKANAVDPQFPNLALTLPHQTAAATLDNIASIGRLLAKSVTRSFDVDALSTNAK